ncbi:LysR family transcriptional regulator [Siccirubricoccus sp. KC 17139]|uniref:LysR family transcriptional regulator n=1 Tax=Siccirubricoccus soli TaxID=2899147 RepID=A0ABT1CZ95_9PROT|nr:LysR family transcriptional regulator [Siccirubricoccus soli]MCO6414998.1 LysR family transcriptional regulator [Siccirubricoccus soli]MCP2681129.1 LysR family transcriptional regulator [Siccirubricoccus soli]
MEMLPDLGARQLQAVLAVAEERSFVAAAARLRLSQPALTRLIQRVEDVLGVALFERSTRRVALTAAGREFVAVAERVLNDLRIAGRSLRELAGEQRGQVILACIMSVAAGPLPRLLAEWRATRPGVELHLREGVHGDVLEAVRSGVADLGITYLEALPEGLAGEALGEAAFRAVLPPGHSLAARPAVTLAELAAEPLISFPAEARTRRLLDGAAAAAGVALRHAATVTQFATMLALVRAGVGVAIVPTAAVPAESGLVLRDLAPPGLRRTIGIVTLAERELAPAAAGLRERLRGLMRQTQE